MLHEYLAAKLSQVHPTHDDFKVTVKLDCSFSREVINFIVSSGNPMKEMVSLDVVLYDEEGTRMLAVLRSEAIDRFAWMIYPGIIYDLIHPAVVVGGEGIHEHYHLLFVEHTHLRDAAGDFPPLPLRIKVLSQIPWSYKSDEGFFDVVGFLKYCSPVITERHRRYCEKEFAIILETCKNGFGWAKDEVRCRLRGSWVEAVHKQVCEAIDDVGPVFVHIRYVISCQPLGLPTVSSYSDASTLDIDPPNPYVQLLKKKMID